jgi:SOS-response transcriptional repressor LexA
MATTWTFGRRSQIGDPLTERQAEIFAFIYETARDRGYQPTYRQLMEKFGILSTNGISCHLKSLADKGWIEALDGEKRGIRFLRRPDGRPFTGFSDKDEPDAADQGQGAGLVG